MVLAPTGVVRPRGRALDRERGSPAPGAKAQASEPWVSRYASWGKRRPAISRTTLMPQLSPTPARARETTTAWGLTLPVHGPTLISWTTGRGSNEQAFISRSFSSSLAHVRG
jgi:hypothetical protein